MGPLLDTAWTFLSGFFNAAVFVLVFVTFAEIFREIAEEARRENAKNENGKKDELNTHFPGRTKGRDFRNFLRAWRK